MHSLPLELIISVCETESVCKVKCRAPTQGEKNSEYYKYGLSDVKIISEIAERKKIHT